MGNEKEVILQLLDAIEPQLTSIRELHISYTGLQGEVKYLKDGVRKLSRFVFDGDGSRNSSLQERVTQLETFSNPEALKERAVILDRIKGIEASIESIIRYNNEREEREKHRRSTIINVWLAITVALIPISIGTITGLIKIVQVYNFYQYQYEQYQQQQQQQQKQNIDLNIKKDK